MEHAKALAIIKRAIVRSYAITTRWKLSMCHHCLKCEYNDIDLISQFCDDRKKLKTILKHLPSTLFLKLPSDEHRGWYGYSPLISNLNKDDISCMDISQEETRLPLRDVMDLNYCNIIYEQFVEKFHTHSSKFIRN